MSKTAHIIFISLLAGIIFITFTALLYNGLSYYNTSLEERVYHTDHQQLKPSGIIGHGLGIAGSLFIIIGVGSYMARKRYRILSRLGLLKHWLEFHIFLCTLGPVMILFHTSYKFGGLVAISFWSMVAVFLSGIIGRFIYLQIPRSIEGRELSLNEIKAMKSDVGEILQLSYKLDEKSYQMIVDSTTRKINIIRGNFFIRFFRKFADDIRAIQKIKSVLKKSNLPRGQYGQILKLVKNEITLNRRIDRLMTMQNLFKYWHVVHLPFALVMLVIMIIHVIVTVVFGFRWIF